MLKDDIITFKGYVSVGHIMAGVDMWDVMCVGSITKQEAGCSLQPVTMSLQSAVMMKGKTGHGHEPWDFSLLFNVSPIHHKYTLTTFVCRTITLLHSCSGQQPPAPHPYNNGNTDAK